MKMKRWLGILLLLPVFGFAQQRVSQPKTKAEALNEQYCSPVFASAHGEYFDLLDDGAAASAMAYTNILEWLRGRVAGLQVYQTRTNVFIPFIRNQVASVYVDEMPVSFDYLNALPAADIAMIKVIKGPFIQNWGGSSGAIAIYTINGDEEDPEEDLPL